MPSTLFLKSLSCSWSPTKGQKGWCQERTCQPFPCNHLRLSIAQVPYIPWCRCRLFGPSLLSQNFVFFPWSHDHFFQIFWKVWLCPTLKRDGLSLAFILIVVLFSSFWRQWGQNHLIWRYYLSQGKCFRAWDPCGLDPCYERNWLPQPFG